MVGVPNVNNDNAREVSLKIFRDALKVDIDNAEITECYVKHIRKSSDSNDANRDASVSNAPSSSNVDGDTNNSGSSNNNIKSVICIRFSSLRAKKLILDAKKIEKKQLNASLLDDNFKNKIFINESLTNYFRALLYASRKTKIDKKYAFVWYSNGRVLLRKDSGRKVVVVKKFHDLENISIFYFF